MSLVSYNELKDSSKQRLAVVFVNIKDPKSAMAKVMPLMHSTTIPTLRIIANNLAKKVDCAKAALDFDPAGNISGASFRTSISRMKRDYSRLSPSDKSRMAACVVNIKEADLKSIMVNVRNLSFSIERLPIFFEMLTMLAQIDWDKAVTDFKPEGKPITGVSFKTSIQRILKPKDKTTAGSAAATAGKKRKAPAATARSSSSPPSEITPSRKKKTKATQALLEEDTAIFTTEEEQVPAGQDPPPSVTASRESSRYVTPPIKSEYIDDEESQADIQYYP